MALLRQIAQLGHPVLRAATDRVSLPASDTVRALIDDMLETLRDANGVGIAAPQVYESSALFIVASRPNPRYPDAPLMEPEVVINPEILECSDERVKGWEGCLSIPGIRGEVPRHRRIRARYQTVEGRVVEKEFRDFVARIFQHEDDHIRGIVFLDRLESNRDVITEKEYQKRLSQPVRTGDGGPGPRDS
jgi:peptide deformylase